MNTKVRIFSSVIALVAVACAAAPSQASVTNNGWTLDAPVFVQQVAKYGPGATSYTTPTGVPGGGFYEQALITVSASGSVNETGYEVEFKQKLTPGVTASQTTSVYLRADWRSTEYGLSGTTSYLLRGYYSPSVSISPYLYTATWTATSSGGNLALQNTITLDKTNGEQYVHFRIRATATQSQSAKLYANLKFANIAPPDA
jgi:hypothetical protein